MDFTPDQYAFLKKFERGVAVTNWNDDEIMCLSHFENLKLIQPRVQVREDWWELTEAGKSVLHQHREAIAAAKIREQEKEAQAVREEAQLDELRKLANAAQARADLAIQQAKEADADAQIARKDAITAQKASRTSNRIAIASVLLNCLQWCFTKDEIIAFLVNVFEGFQRAAQWLLSFFQSLC